jgi:hypothetical protein
MGVIMAVCLRVSRQTLRVAENPQGRDVGMNQNVAQRATLT